MRIAVIGTGYVGLVTAICLADNGNDVIGVDSDRRKVEALQAGQLPIYEPGLSDLLRTNLGEARIRFTSHLQEAVEHSKIIFLTVGTPPRQDGSADLSAVETVARQVAELANEPKILVTKSTVPIGTGDRLEQIIALVARHPITVVSNPEFLKEGSALDDFLRPDRVIIGADDPAAADTIRHLYEPFVRNAKPILVMSRRAAEMSKYAANAYLAMRISFINEMAGICEKLGVDVNEMRAGIGSDGRIGHHFLYPSPGYGGSCFPKDVQALAHVARTHQAQPRLLDSVHAVNEHQKGVIFEKVVERFGPDLAGRRFALWGVTFKAKTDDIRESPALRMIDLLLQAKASVVASDPEGLANLKAQYGDRVCYESDSYEALNGTDGLIIMTEWNRYRSPDFPRMRRLLKAPAIFDGRNLYDLAQMKTAGFEYYCIGRQSVIPAAATVPA